MRLINADDVLNYIDRELSTGLGKKKSLEFLIKFIQKSSTVDAVQVVHCKDCYWMEYCKYVQHLGLEGYCSKAESILESTEDYMHVTNIYGEVRQHDIWKCECKEGRFYVDTLRNYEVVHWNYPEIKPSKELLEKAKEKIEKKMKQC